MKRKLRTSRVIWNTALTAKRRTKPSWIMPELLLNIKNIAAPETLWSRIESRLQEEEKRGLFSRIKESLYTYRIAAVSLAFAAVAAVLLFVSPGPPNNASDFIEDNMSYLASLRNTSQEPDNDLDFGTTIEYFFM